MYIRDTSRGDELCDAEDLMRYDEHADAAYLLFTLILVRLPRRDRLHTYAAYRLIVAYAMKKRPPTLTPYSAAIVTL